MMSKLQLKSVLYVCDQRFYISSSGKWYTTASFAKEVILAFPGIEKWTFFGRLYKTESVENLFLVEAINGIEVTFVGPWNMKRGLLAYFMNAFRILWMLDKSIKSHTTVYLKFSFVSSYIASFILVFRKRFVITHLVGDFDALIWIKRSIRNKWIVKMSRIIYKKIVKLSKIQLYVSNQLLVKYGSCNQNSFVVCENRVSKEKVLDYSEVSRREECEPLKLAYYGRLSPEKNIISLLKAMQALQNVKLDIYGDGADNEFLVKYVKDHELSSCVNFCGYVKWGDDLFRSMRNYHCLVLPSFTEGMPLVIIEGMSMGLCIVASRVGGIPELVIEGVNGLLFDPNEVDDIILKIESLKFEDIRLAYIRESLRTAINYSLEMQVSILEKALASRV